YAPDRSFWVACRGSGTAVRVGNIDGVPAVGQPVAVGSEPSAIAVTPAGTRVVTANYADGTLSLIDTTAANAVSSVSVGQNPRALAITNGGAGDDTKEVIFATLMFGQPVGGGQASEGN